MANKGNGIYQLSKILNINKKDIISFGNDLNDISMFKNSEIGIAVSNSEEIILNLAGEITLSNEEDGVVIWLQNNIINKNTKI